MQIEFHKLKEEASMVKKIKEITGYSGGKEGGVSGLTGFFLAIGIIALVVIILIATGTKSLELWILFGAVCLIEGLALLLYLRQKQK
jgi:hypothetical protein